MRMKINLTFRFCEYEDSKIATFISMMKGSVAGFFAWLGLFLLPFMIGCGIASGYGAAGTVAIIIAIVAVLSYIGLFFIHEDSIAAKAKKKRSPRKIKKLSRNNQVYVPIEKLRLRQIVKATAFANIYIQKLSIADEFLSTREEIVETLNNDLLVFEMLYKEELYNEYNEQTAAVLSQQGMKAVAISLYTILALSDDFPQIRHGEIYGAITKVIHRDMKTNSTAICSMSKQELKIYFVDSIRACIVNN